MLKLLKTIPLTSLLLFVACNGEENPNPELNIPKTYFFTRDGASTVDYSGQTARLDMLNELTTYVRTANDGVSISEQLLYDMYANENTPFSTESLNTSGKQLENKTFLADIDFFKSTLSSAAHASEATEAASQGQAGLIDRGPDKSILINEKGWEYTQIIQKGLMGAVFLNQIFNEYLTDAKIGNDIDNEELVTDKNYTTMEHHWDEAFGYWGVNTDFDPEGVNRFWGNYTYGREAYLGSATILKEAFLTGRAAIVAKQYDVKNAQRDIIYEQFELIAAATAIHYLNESIIDFNNADTGNLFHHASEGYGFVMALKYSPFKAISSEQIDTILNSNFGTGGDLWTISLDGLQAAKTTLKSAYPALAEIADEL